MIAGLALCPASSLAAQAGDAQVRAQQDTLTRIRAEREALEREAASLRTRAHDLSEEVNNLDSRAAATARIVTQLDRQVAFMTTEVATATSRLQSTEAELDVKQDALRRHLVEIYKRGPLFTEEALFSARSFGELVARYKYLHLLTLRDRSLVHQVAQLRDQVAFERRQMVQLHDRLDFNRREKAGEEQRLLLLRRDRASTFRSVQQQQDRVAARIAEYRKAESLLANKIAALDAARRRSESARPASAPKAASTLLTSDYGKLAWPVEGDLLYTFGKAQTATNTTIRWNGVGIGAPVNTQVKSVAAGKVALVGPIGTYGLTVILDHGAGDYSVYGSLGRADVKQGQAVAKGEVIGTAGVSDPDLPSHLHFEIRRGNPIPAAVDPVAWLRARR